MAMKKRYITVSEDGSILFWRDEVPPEFFPAADDGLYDIIDITDPECPLQYIEEGWTNVDEHE